MLRVVDPDTRRLARQSVLTEAGVRSGTSANFDNHSLRCQRWCEIMRGVQVTNFPVQDSSSTSRIIAGSRLRVPFKIAKNSPIGLVEKMRLQVVPV